MITMFTGRGERGDQGIDEILNKKLKESERWDSSQHAYNKNAIDMIVVAPV